MFKSPHFKNKWLWLVFALFVAITFWGLINHQPWRDEAQAWLIVRDLPLTGVIKQMPYEGSPPLWHLIIFPLANLGLPYETELVVHYFIVLAVIFVFLFYSPLPKIIKFVLPFNYYFLFEYALVARNYSLTALILFLIAAIYQRRFQKPIIYAGLIFLLAWTNIHSLAIAGLLFAWFILEIIKEKREDFKDLAAAVIMLLGLASAVIMLIPQIDQVKTNIFSGFNVLGQSLALALVPFNPGVLPSSLLWLFALSWLPITFWLLKKWETKVIFCTSYLWLAYIFLFKHDGDLRHYGLILIIFLFLWWLDLINEKESLFKRKKINELGVYLFFSFMVISAIYAGYFYLHNQNYYFSGAKEMAEYLKANDLLTEEIAAFPSYSGSALLPYLPGKEFYQMETFKKGTYLTWNNSFYLGTTLPYPVLKYNLIKYYQENHPEINSVLFLTTIPDGYDSELELITASQKPTVKEDEFFYLYRLKIK